MNHGQFLELDRCPHCSIAKPLLSRVWGAQTQAHSGGGIYFWATHICSTCGGAVIARSAHNQNVPISGVWPAPQTVAETVPVRAREYLTQSLTSLHAPSGAVMLAASAVDAMLKEKGYKKGNLNDRIDAAAKEHLITQEMGAWAHEIRLDANDQRHADEEAALPTEADAMKAIEFAQALAQFLFILPARVARGREGQ
jgi:hypothetical protein